MNELHKACAIAISKQKEAFGAGAKETKIREILETEDAFLIDFHNKYGTVVYGDGGLIVSKKDFSVDHFSIPSYPENIFDILDKAVVVNIPKEYA